MNDINMPHPHDITIKLSDAEIDSIYAICACYGITLSRLVEAFVRDLIGYARDEDAAKTDVLAASRRSAAGKYIEHYDSRDAFSFLAHIAREYGFEKVKRVALCDIYREEKPKIKEYYKRYMDAVFDLYGKDYIKQLESIDMGILRLYGFIDEYMCIYVTNRTGGERG